MENVELPLETSGKSGKRPRRDRVARCSVCTNEWPARNGNEDKPSRCPVCGSTVVKWRDECTPEEMGESGKAAENMESRLFGVELPPEKVENSPEPESTIKTQDFPLVENSGKDGMEKPTLEDIQKNFKGIPVFPLIWILGIIGVFGLIWFLHGQVEKRRIRRKIPLPETYHKGTMMKSRTQGQAF